MPFVRLFSVMVLLLAMGPGWLVASDEEEIRARGQTVSTALFGQLMQTLEKKIQAEGIEAAIGFCRLEAIPLTEKTAASMEGVKSLRRIGVRTRNPANVSDEVDREVLQHFLENWASEQARAPIVRTVAAPDGGRETRFYRPVSVGASCLACHGSKEMLLPNVLSAIEEQYPEDQATGFSEGELRGAIVVTFPAEAAPTGED
jgi:hypothetical protein